MLCVFGLLCGWILLTEQGENMVGVIFYFNWGFLVSSSLLYPVSFFFFLLKPNKFNCVAVMLYDETDNSMIKLWVEGLKLNPYQLTVDVFKISNRC